jgi:DNA invertase Pin-like site-specific DNA recombinase
MIATEQVPVEAQPFTRIPDPVVTPSKVQSRHLERLAVVYIRQSTLQQVQEHRESTALQYALRSRAIAWGWSEDRVLVIDEDLGCSGASAEGRTGFQRLLAEVSLGHVGLVLGLKGTLSEAELHVLRQRMNEGRLNKARRGELFNHPPMGYVRLTGEKSGGALAIDPDQQVQLVIRLIFEKFEQLGTLNALLRYLVKNQIGLPVRPFGGAQRGQLQWHRPNRQTLRNLLHHPIYAGAYTWGRRPVDPRRKIPGRPSTGRKVTVAEQCQVMIKDRCPAYITWPQYEANRRRLAENRNLACAQGAPREGPALLGGLLVCGQCGQRLNVQYHGKCNDHRYACTRNYSSYAAPLCQGICGRVLDELIERLALKVLEPASVELSLAAVADLQQEQQRLDRHWQQRLERARYESDRAARQYHATEPENRLVARELETRWEQTLLDQRGVEEAYARFLHEQPVELSQADRAAVQALSSAIPALWHSPATTSAERKQIIRHLIEKVTLLVPPQQEIADVRIHWAGGLVSHHQLIRPVARYEQLRDYDRLSQRISALRQSKHNSAQIAALLNAEGWRPPKRRATFNAGMVRAIFHRRNRATARPVAYRLKPGEWWFGDLAHALQLPHPTLYSWMRRGWINARQLDIGQGRWIVWADDEELDRLRRLRSCPRSWHCQPQAADLTRPKPWPQDSSKV